MDTQTDFSYPEHFQLEFYKARFPIRFCLAVVLCIGTLWITDAVTNGHMPIDFELVTAHLALASVFTLISLALLKFFNNIFAQVRSLSGMLLAYSSVILVAGALYLVRYLSGSAAGWFWELPYLRHIHIDTTGLLVFLTLLVALPLFWLERQVFAARARTTPPGTSHFSNRGFHIRPHFLFNSLNSVAHLIGTHPTRAEKALYNLADIFREIMAEKRDRVPLKAELELADKYLFLEKTRLGERLQVSSRIDPRSLDVLVPVLLLQPLLENAVYHGIETRFKGGTINLRVQVANNRLIIIISNPLPEGSIRQVGGNPLVQEDLRQRISQTYGSQGTFYIDDADERYTVTLRLPL